MAQLNPYLHFDGTCREAMEFYKVCLGGELEFQTVGQSPMAGKMPPEAKDRIMHSTLKKDDWILMASDMMDPKSFTKGDTISLCLGCESKEEIEDLYKKLSVGADIFMELKEEFFGWFAMFTDKFGVEWMLQAESGPKS